MKKHFLKYLAITMAAAFMLTGCLEENEVMPPIPYEVPETPSKINKDNLNTFNGKYIVNHSTTSNPDVMNFKGNFFITNYTADQNLSYYFLLQPNGYAGLSDINIRKNNNSNISSNYTILDDNLTIQFDPPIIITDNDSKEYTINSIRKSSDKLITLDDNIYINDIDNSIVAVCDPRLETGETCSSVEGAVKYIGAYRIDNIECGATQYIGGQDFAGEMAAAPFLDSLLNVNLYLYLKIQVQNEQLKQCLLTDEQKINNILYISKHYYIQGSEAVNLGAVFANVGLIGINDDESETVRTTQIDYTPKDNDASYSDILFNGNKIKMRLKKMYNGTLNADPAKNIDSTTPYFTNN